MEAMKMFRLRNMAFQSSLCLIGGSLLLRLHPVRNTLSMVQL
jgi:hypothetical protein